MIEFYCGSGSPYSWRVWLALEHKALPYRLHLMSFGGGDLASASFRAINPRGKVPAIVDDGFALAESAAILEYLDDAYPDARSRIFPQDIRERARVRRMIRDADEYVSHPLEALVEQVLLKPAGEGDAEAIQQARDAMVGELARWEPAIEPPFLAGTAGAADFTLYPLVALALRIEAKRHPDLALRAALGPRFTAWMAAVESLPYFERTYPPHWRTA